MADVSPATPLATDPVAAAAAPAALSVSFANDAEDTDKDAAKDAAKDAEDGDGAAFLKKSRGDYRPARDADFERAGFITKADFEDSKAMKECDYCFSEIPKKATRCKHCGSGLSKKSQETSDLFDVVREEGTHEEFGFKETFVQVFVKIKDQTMLQTLRCYMDQPDLYDKEPKISAEELFTILPNLRQNGAGYTDKKDDPLHSLVEFLEKEFEEQSKKFEALRAEGMVTFESLRYLFNRNSKFWGKVDGLYKVGSTVIDTSFQRTQMSTVFVINAEVIKSKGDQFFSMQHNFTIPQFRGSKKILDLNLQPMDDETLAMLTERGRIFNKHGTGCHFLDYKGPMSYKTQYYKTQWAADGRVMIDGISFNKMNPSYGEFVSSDGHRQFGRGGGGDESASSIQSVPEDSLFKCWHTVGGFSFRTKKWGEILIQNVSEIKFDDHAYERLVLPLDKKDLIHGLIMNTSSSFTDIISGKGAGCIFLLHGPPGTGKTLTAEAVAELLHRPLYSVSVGELGVDTSSLEAALRDILDVASVWNSVILIDEADVFLEKRTDNDINRNALVGIFLRMLEYHEGIMFLTTNRVKRFDEAFHSRISVALKYPDLSADGRAQVWRTLLGAAGLSGFDVAQLASHELNGRQIRTTIRLAQALARAQTRPVNMSDFEETIAVSDQFKLDLAELSDDELLAQEAATAAAAAAASPSTHTGGLSPADMLLGASALVLAGVFAAFLRSKRR